jgi:hypothetical protein
MARIALLLLAPALAQASVTVAGEQDLEFDRPESWAMKYFASATLMTGMGPPRDLGLGHVRLALDAGWIPRLDQTQRTVGFGGTKEEDLNKLPAFARLRISLGLPAKLSFTVGWIPPIEINGVRANLFAMALGRPFRLPYHLTVGVSVYGQVGNIDGDFTCPGRWLNDPTRNPLGCTRASHDQVELNYGGVEVTLSQRFAHAHGLEPYLGVAVNYMNLAFQVDAVYGESIDTTRLHTQGATFSMDTGLLFPITRRLDIGSELFYSPLTVHRPQNSNGVDGIINLRAILAVRL